MSKNNIMKLLLLLIIILISILFINRFKYVEGFQNDKNVTVVSAYYPMKSKHSIEEYKKWMKDFYGSIGFNLVFFTNKEYTPLIKEIRKDFMENTLIITLEFEDLEVFKKYPMSFWADQKKIDHESYHTPELYAIWYEKKEFIKKVSLQNPFNTEYFIWMDAGVCRDKKWIPYLKEFPNVNKIPKNKILISRITDDFEEFDDLKHKDCVGGNLIAGHKNTWDKYYKLYDTTMEDYIRKKKFVGKDQSIIGTTVINNKELFDLYKTKDVKTKDYEYNIWSALLFYLAS